jgi:hypothetical protein
MLSFKKICYKKAIETIKAIEAINAIKACFIYLQLIYNTFIKYRYRYFLASRFR